MLARTRRLLGQFFSKSRTINNEPLNKVSLIVIILVDIFILISVFVGLDDISRWYISPLEAYPCYSEWENHRTQTVKDKDYQIIRLALPNLDNPLNFQQTYQQAEVEHLGNVSKTCLTYGDNKDRINNSRNQQALKTIDQKQAKITSFEQVNDKIRAQYDSTLLERIAGQARDQSINSVGAETAKQELERNNRIIATLKQENYNLKNKLVRKSESVNFITLLNNEQRFKEVREGYRHASFWYPSIQLAFQSLFLVPLIIAGLLLYNFAQRKRYGLISLISWHLLVIFFIPLVLKIFEFLQVGAIFKFVFDIITVLFGSLIFLISYVYILLLPLVGFGIIKFSQRFVFNPKLQAANRIQKLCCVKCAKKIRQQDSYCPHCGYYQYFECQNCQNFTYKYLPYCKQCGHPQDPGNL